MKSARDIEEIFENHEFVYEGIRSKYYGELAGQPYRDVETGWDQWEEVGSEGERVDGLGLVHLIEDFGGGEGSGETRYLVFSVTSEDGSERFFKKNGYYASHDGSYFDGSFDEVVPVRKTITVYETKR